MYMENKDNFYQAFKGIEKYSASACKLMHEFLSLESNNQVTASIDYLLKSTGLTKPTVYSSIKTLKKDNIISKNNDYRNTYDFNELKINEIIDLYEQQQSKIKT